ncbi:MAG: biotin/lipoate A/B protein ligase family protein [Planctomycetota bacterium]|jgi:lipoate-protein ligase A
MYFHEHTCDTPVENLAWDEAVLEGAEQMEGSEALRVWEMPRACVVVGRASRVDDEVFVERCSRDNVPILRRMSGGSAIVAGPGCLMYSALLSLEERPECRNVDAAHRTVMERTRRGVESTLRRHGIEGTIAVEGICDLTWNGFKISGNALRVKRHWLMYHGTILLTMPLEWISQYLKVPPRQPAYREGRAHDRFVTSLRPAVEDVPTFQSDLAKELANAWDARLAWIEHPLASKTAELARDWMERRYADPAWHGERGGTRPP